MRWGVILALLAVAACGKPEPPAKAPAPATPPPAPKAEAPASQGVYAPMTTVDFQGKPVPGMVPIATNSANAFDEPIAHGNPTDEKGKSSLTLPQETHLFVRAWDPQMKMFAENFYEMPAMKGTSTDAMTVTMVPAAAAEAAVFGPDGKPLPNADVHLMLIHPKRGPWWPARGTTDSAGLARFAPVPPGEFVLDFNVEGVGKAEMPVTFLPPTRNTPLGAIHLK
jgi:hypothetical protein